MLNFLDRCCCNRGEHADRTSVPYLMPYRLFLQLPRNNCSESFEKSILRLLNKADETDSCDVEERLR